MKTLLLFISALSLSMTASLVASQAAHADNVTPSAKAWADEVRASVRGNLARLDLVDQAASPLPHDVNDTLASIADDQAQVWADTILESDFTAEEGVVVETVETIQSRSAFLGYRVTYSSKAVDTSTCDPRLDISLCDTGRIVESSFVAPKLDAWVRDDSRFAKYVSNNPDASSDSFEAAE